MAGINAILCILAWAFVIVVPLYASYSFSRSGLRQRFCEHAKKLNGTVVKTTSEWIEVQLPGPERPIDAAFFVKGTHWFGKDTLEIHFPIPDQNQYEFFACCQCQSSKQIPAGWVSNTIKIAGWRAVVAAPNHQSLEGALSLGIESFFGQFRQSVAPKSCRVAIEGDVVKFFIKQYQVGITEFSSILSMGTRFSQQVSMLVGGAIQLNETSEDESEKICPVCSCEVINPQECSRCKTAHCSECWSFNNYACGVFGCGGSIG